MKNLVIVFAKNPKLGFVKTRLAKDIGDDTALRVYERLLDITERATADNTFHDTHIYYRDELESVRWSLNQKFLQKGSDLGEIMKNAFDSAFEMGYERVVGVGTDLPTLTKNDLAAAFEFLAVSDFVFGPALDGGYYLVGTKEKNAHFIFENKQWSTADLLLNTLHEIRQLNYSVNHLTTKNDIDNLSDLRHSILAKEFLER